MPDERESAGSEPPPSEHRGVRDSARNWGVVLGGAVLGFTSWVFAMFVVVIASLESNSGTTDAVLPWLLGAALLCAVGLIVWPRTRRLGEGLLLGFAIGLVVAGGICIPLVVSGA